MPRLRSPRISASPQASPPASPNHGLPATQKPGGRGRAANAAGCPEPPAEMPAVTADVGGLAGFEVGDDGEDAAMVVVGFVQVQLGQDAADAFLDGDRSEQKK